MAIATSFEQVTNNSPDGAQMGQGTDEKIAFFGSTPVIQPVSGNQAVVSLTIETLTESSGQSTPNTTIVDVTGGVTNPSGDGLDATGKTEIDALFVLCDDNFADLADQQSKTRVDLTAVKLLVDQIRADIVTLGLIKGAS